MTHAKWCSSVCVAGPQSKFIWEKGSTWERATAAQGSGPGGREVGVRGREYSMSMSMSSEGGRGWSGRGASAGGWRGGVGSRRGGSAGEREGVVRRRLWLCVRAVEEEGSLFTSVPGRSPASGLGPHDGGLASTLVLLLEALSAFKGACGWDWDWDAFRTCFCGGIPAVDFALEPVFLLPPCSKRSRRRYSRMTCFRTVCRACLASSLTTNWNSGLKVAGAEVGGVLVCRGVLVELRVVVSESLRCMPSPRGDIEIASKVPLLSSSYLRFPLPLLSICMGDGL